MNDGARPFSQSRSASAPATKPQACGPAGPDLTSLGGVESVCGRHRVIRLTEYVAMPAALSREVRATERVTVVMTPAQRRTLEQRAKRAEANGRAAGARGRGK